MLGNSLLLKSLKKKGKLTPTQQGQKVGPTIQHAQPISGFPLGLENLEKWEGILNRLEKSGKTTQNTGKLR